MATYEERQIEAIELWKRARPGITGRAFDAVVAPVTWIAVQVVPFALVRRAIDGADIIARSTTGAEDIMRAGKVASIEELRTRDLQLSDRLAATIHRRSIAAAGAAGGVLGATGVGGVALDIGTLITLSLRTIHKIGLCYGYEQLNDKIVMGILSVSSAADREQRKTAIELMRDVETIAIRSAWEGLAEDAVLASAAKAGAFFTARGMGKRFGQRLLRRKALQLVPLVGAAISGTTNVSFVSDVGWAARRTFQERWLIDNGRLPTTSEDRARVAR